MKGLIEHKVGPMDTVDPKKLAGLIEGIEFDWYVGIATGGIPIMFIVAQTTGVKNLDVYVPWKFKNFKHLAGQRVLLIDDVVETGMTMRLAVWDLKSWQPKSLKTMSLTQSVGSIFNPDYCLVRNAEQELKMRMEFVERQMMGWRGDVDGKAEDCQ